jgi:hypothetical protein
MTEYTFSRFIYMDTNIISHFVKNEHLWSNVFEYLQASGLTLGVGGGQVSELSDAKSLLTDLARFLVSVPTGIIKNWDEIIAEEVDTHPESRTASLLMYPLNAILLEDNGFTNLLNFLNSKTLSDAREDQLKHARQMKSQHKKLKSNFPPASSGKYKRSQANEFAMAQVFQWLSYDHRDFLLKIQQDISQLNIEVFQSIRLFAYVLFYKYYMGQRDPNKLSDFGDLFHLFPIPYCEVAVMERDLANVLNQIKNTQAILGDTEIVDIDFIKRFEHS